MIRYTIQEDEVGKRLDTSLVLRLPNMSRSSLQKISEQGMVTVNGRSEKTGYRLRIGDKIAIDYDEVKENKVPDIELSILYEDDDCVVINKPVGVLTHSKGAFNPEATVASWLQRRLESDGQNIESIFPSSKPQTPNSRNGIVHRLDRATSGVMICAKNLEALSWLQKQFSQRKVKKTYVAIISGELEPKSAIIDMPIERNPRKPQTFRVGSNGKASTTQYETTSQSEGYSLLTLKPTTGRTHQLRVHLKQLKHPIVGDVLYDGQSANRLFLHAQSLEVTLPNKERKIFDAPLPKEFNQFMNGA